MHSDWGAHPLGCGRSRPRDRELSGKGIREECCGEGTATRALVLPRVVAASSAVGRTRPVASSVEAVHIAFWARRQSAVATTTSG
jgi:hypothetical protein